MLDKNGKPTEENGNIEIFMRLDSYQEIVVIEYYGWIAAISSIGGLVGAILPPFSLVLQYISMIQFEAKIIKKLFYKYRSR
jgi:hypothetical protein